MNIFLQSFKTEQRFKGKNGAAGREICHHGNNRLSTLVELLSYIKMILTFELSLNFF